MKRLLSLSLVLSFILILLISFVSAQLSDLEEKVNQLEEGRDKFDEVIDNPNIVAQDYLTQEWTKILETKEWGKGILATKDLLIKANPLFKIILGVEFELSWLFFLVLFLWIVLFIYVYRTFHLYGFFSEGIGIMISFLIMVIISTMRIPLIIGEWIVGIISIASSPWIQIVFIFLLILVLIIATYFSKSVEEFFKQARVRREKMKEEMNRLELDAHTKAGRAFSKAISEGLRTD